MVLFFFFFSFLFFFSSRRRHTRLVSDWSSDVCSSDLASLTSAAVVSRDVDAGPTMPAMLQMDQSVVGAFQFSSTRGSDPGLSVLEISSCPNPDAVTSEDPLKLRVNSSIADNEKVLALGKEGDLFVPVGYGKCTGDRKSVV